MCGPTGVQAYIESGPAKYRKGFFHPRRKNADMFWTRHDYIFEAKSAQTSLSVFAMDMKNERIAAGVSTNSSLIAIDDVGIRKMTVLGMALECISLLLESLRLIKTPPHFEPQMPRP